MKKSTKILGSVALSAALAMGTAVPAFAAESDNGDGLAGVSGTNPVELEDGETYGTGDTTVNISTYTSQISVTVPLNVTFALDTVGGDGMAPTAGAYKIVNSTPVPVYVTSAEITPESEFAFGAAALTSTSTATGSMGDIYAEFNPTAKKGIGTDGSTVMKLTSATNDNDDLDWVVAANAGGGDTYTFALPDGTEVDFTTAKSNRADYVDDGYISSAMSASIKNASSWADASLATYITNGTGGTATFTKTEGNESSLGFTIDVSSTPLKNAVDVTNKKAASIVYTISVVDPTA